MMTIALRTCQLIIVESFAVRTEHYCAKYYDTKVLRLVIETNRRVDSPAGYVAVFFFNCAKQIKSANTSVT
jgi:hypothetical protein